MGWELTIPGGTGTVGKLNGRETSRETSRETGRETSRETRWETSRQTRRETRLHVGMHRNHFVAFITTAVFYVPCMCDSGIQGHTNGSTRTCTSSTNNIMARNVTACV